uniref:Uncharacterized protein n=1 Tax=Anguilla anguilla TaxID=7936 RepID=A0A0E9XA05_ANGAN
MFYKHERKIFRRNERSKYGVWESSRECAVIVFLHHGCVPVYGVLSQNIF